MISTLVALLVIGTRAALVSNYPIDFYAIVLDKDDKPMAGVKVTAVVTYDNSVVPMPWATTPGEHRIIAETDANGKIRLVSSGYAFTLFLEKAGYSSAPETLDVRYSFSVGRHDGIR